MERMEKKIGQAGNFFRFLSDLPFFFLFFLLIIYYKSSFKI